MKISTDYPPNYKDILAVFGKSVIDSKPTFCYGDTIYSPFNKEVPPDIQAHEEVHSKQQGDYPEVWWYKYLNDKDFRLSQELEAYGEQYIFALRSGVKGKLKEWVLENIAKSLSSELYGNLLLYQEAHSKIRNYGKYSG